MQVTVGAFVGTHPKLAGIVAPRVIRRVIVAGTTEVEIRFTTPLPVTIPYAIIRWIRIAVQTAIESRVTAPLARAVLLTGRVVIGWIVIADTAIISTTAKN